MKQKFTIALLQLIPCSTAQENLAKGLKACEQAHVLGADLAIFPEMWQLGYQPSLFTDDNALERDSQFTKQFCAKAQELKMAVAITYLGQSDGQPSNNVALIDQTGSIILEYSKVYVCNFESGIECGLCAGKDFYVTNLSYAHGAVRIGAMICFDREFPEAARALAKKGAELIIVPNACKLVQDQELGDIRLQQIRSRAFENMVVMVVANYPEPKEDGNSCVCVPSGAIIAQAGVSEEILLATVDLAAVRKWRTTEVWGPKNS